jgi:hypothetical protein
VLHHDEPSPARRLSDLRKGQPASPTLQNLLGILSAKLDLCARLPIYEYEAASQGHETCTIAFRRLAEVERESCNEMLQCLRDHIEETAKARDVAADGGAGCARP